MWGGEESEYLYVYIQRQKGKFARCLTHHRDESKHAREPPLTLLYIVDESLEFRDVFCLFSQGVKDHVIVGWANHIRLPQLTLQQSDLSLLLSHLETLWTHMSSKQVKDDNAHIHTV